MEIVMRHEARQVPSWLIFDVGQKQMKFLAIACVAFLYLCGCSPSLDRPVVFRLPAGFEGPFVLLEDQHGSADFTKEKSGYFLDIPRNGVARVPSVNLLGRWHKAFITFPDGTRFEQQNGISDFKDGPDFWQGPSVSFSDAGKQVNYIWFYVRPRKALSIEEHQAWLRARGVIR